MANKKKEEVVVEESPVVPTLKPVEHVELVKAVEAAKTVGTKEVAFKVVSQTGVVITKEVASDLLAHLEGSFSRSNNVPFRKDLKRLIGALSEGLAAAE